MGEFVEIRLRHAPKELRDRLSAEAEERGITLESYALTILWDRNGTGAGLIRDKSGTNSGQRKKGREKFEPPSDEWAAEKYREKGYHFDLKKFLATYKAQGWKLGNGRPMTDCEATMEKWEVNWREREGTKGNGAVVGQQGYDTGGNQKLIDEIKAGKGW